MIATTMHLLILLGMSVDIVNSRSSSSESHLPMSLSSIIQDLEAEGVTELSTATILTSKSVTSFDRSSLYQQLLPTEEDNEEETDENFDEMTAFGITLGDEDDDDDENEPKVGIVFANPSAGGGDLSTNTLKSAATVLSTHGSIIYICHPVDLQREEGLFRTLAPAVERILQLQNLNKNTDQDDAKAPAQLIVVFQGVDSTGDPSALEEAQAKFETAASTMLCNIIQSSTNQKIEQIQDVFESVEYLSESSVSSDLCQTLINGKGQLLGPEDAAALVTMAVQESRSDSSISHSPLSTVDLAVSRKLGPTFTRKALQSTLTRIQEMVSLNSNEENEIVDDDLSQINLVTNFGELVDASIAQTMEEFDEIVSTSKIFQKSPITKRKRSDLLEQIYTEVGDMYDQQLSELTTACFESFRKGLSKLRLSPTLPQDMQDVASEAIQQFQKCSKKLLPQNNSQNQASYFVQSHWSSIQTAKTQFQRRLKDHCRDRLTAARASGNYKPFPRQGLTVGLHWLLPKPLGDDYRQSPSQLLGEGADLVYSPPTNKMAEIGEEEVRKNTGDWRRSIIPIPGGSDLFFQFEDQQG